MQHFKPMLCVDNNGYLATDASGTELKTIVIQEDVTGNSTVSTPVTVSLLFDVVYESKLKGNINIGYPNCSGVLERSSQSTYFTSKVIETTFYNFAFKL